MKTGEDGVLERRRQYFTEVTGESMAYTVRATEDGGCVFTGHATGATGNGGPILVKVAD